MNGLFICDAYKMYVRVRNQRMHVLLKVIVIRFCFECQCLYEMKTSFQQEHSIC